jgi:putative peptidoglycan lipid II flippase
MTDEAGAIETAAPGPAPAPTPPGRAPGSTPPHDVARPPTRLARTALLLLPLQAVFRGGEALLPLFLAAWFGRNEETDLYYLLAAYFVFAGSMLTAAFQDSAVVPVLIEVESREPARFPAIAGALLGHTLAIGAAIAIVMGAIAAAIAAIAFGMSHSHGLALELVGVMSLGILVTAVRAFYVGLLNARGVFHAHPVGSGLGMAVTWGVLYTWRDLGVRIVPFGLVAGEIVAVVVLSTLTRRVLGTRLAPNLDRPEPVRRIFSLVRLEVAGSLITRINPVIDQLMAGLAGVLGGGTLLRYAGDVASLPTSILQAVLFPVLLTRLAREATRPAEFAATTRRTLFAVVSLLAAFSAVFIALRVPLCTLLFLHGAMDRAGVARIAAIVPWALVGAAPFGALLVLARAHVARQNSRIMPGMGVLNSALNAGFNLLFVGPLGLAGIALSTSMTYLVVAVVFWVRLPRAARG